MRKLDFSWKLPVIITAIGAGLFHYYAGGFGSPEPRIYRGLHLAILIPVVFWFYPATARSPKHRPSVVDILIGLVCIASSLYTVFRADYLNERFIGYHDVLTIEVVLGSLLGLAVIEACRRALSKWFAVTVGVVLVYLFTCQHWPGLFKFNGFTFDRAIEILYMPNDDGLFGFLTGLSAEILYIYIIFAAVMLRTGAGDFLIDFSSWLAGRYRGGSAKIAVISSAMYGTVSGSTVANVYATGSFTIPMMKRAGYSGKQAAAVEAISGVGGQIMPPIMGAGSFIIAEVTGVPYLKVVTAAIIPAVLYYLGVMSMVHFIAVKRDIQPVSRKDLPQFRRIIRRIYFFLPFVVIIGLLAGGYSPAKAAFHTIWFTLVLSFLDRNTWLNRDKLLSIFTDSLVNASLIAAVLAGAGMIVSVLTRTGVALSFSSILVSASQGVLLLAMVLIFVVVSVLGTGIPTTAAYVIGVTVGAQALGNFGVPLLAAHLFVFYYSVLADMTPPDAVTSFAAANLAKSDPMATGIEGFKLGIAGFLVPFAFVYQPALLLDGSYLQIIYSTATTAFGVICLASGVIGGFFGKLNPMQRAGMIGGAFLLVFGSQYLTIAGLALCLGSITSSYFKNARRSKSQPLVNL